MSSLSENRGNEKVVYTSCAANCGSNHQCIFKAHVRDGRVRRVEPDDRYNTGVGREDEILTTLLMFFYSWITKYTSVVSPQIPILANIEIRL